MRNQSVLAIGFFAAALFVAAPANAQQSGAAAAAPTKLSASAIQIGRPEPSQELVIPEDFRVATYENVISQIEKTKKFQTVYRIGDKRAADVKDLVTIKLIPAAYTAGSQKQREVTTVKGATSITFKVQFIDKTGNVLMEKQVEGKVRFYGENLNATYDFAKKVAKIVNESF